jgi:hypothetical protein
MSGELDLLVGELGENASFVGLAWKPPLSESKASGEQPAEEKQRP